MQAPIRHRRFAMCVVVLTLAACRELTQPQHPVGAVSRAQEVAVGNEDNGPVVTVDHLVPHTSTVPANAETGVQLFLRERVRSDISDGKTREAIPTLAGIALR